jgi:hypothetical protein
VPLDESAVTPLSDEDDSLDSELEDSSPPEVVVVPELEDEEDPLVDEVAVPELSEVTLDASTHRLERQSSPGSHPPPWVHAQPSVPGEHPGSTQKLDKHVRPSSHDPPSVHSHPKPPGGHGSCVHTLSIKLQSKPSLHRFVLVHGHPGSPTGHCDPGPPVNSSPKVSSSVVKKQPMLSAIAPT